MQEWISVKHKQPPKDIPFLGYVKLGYWIPELGKDHRKEDIQVCVWDNLYKDFKEGCNCSGYERDLEYIGVSHWMPLPPTPQD
jgi:hypothetical protein